jgi:hypothetical protein
MTDISNTTEVKHCCVCNEVATKVHYSFLGGIPFYVCEYHHEHTFPAMGHCDKLNKNRMGLMNHDCEWVDLVYYKQKTT